jgi:hypothetical protein
MDLDVTPTPGPTERRALLLALGRAEATARTGDPYRQAWRVAGLRESVENEDEDGYAFSPRSTRGATRA